MHSIERCVHQVFKGSELDVSYLTNNSSCGNCNACNYDPQNNRRCDDCVYIPIWVVEVSEEKSG